MLQRVLSVVPRPTEGQSDVPVGRPLPERPSSSTRRAFRTSAHGAALTLIGIAAIVAALASEMLGQRAFGIVFMSAGFLHLLSAFPERATPMFWFSTLSGLVSVLIGSILVFYPLPASLSLAILLIFFFVYEAVAAFAMAIEAQESGRGWLWPGLYGAFDILFAALVAVGTASNWKMPLLIVLGASLAIGGLCLMRFQARSMPKAPAVRLVN